MAVGAGACGGWRGEEEDFEEDPLHRSLVAMWWRTLQHVRAVRPVASVGNRRDRPPGLSASEASLQRRTGREAYPTFHALAESIVCEWLLESVLERASARSTAVG